MKKKIKHLPIKLFGYEHCPAVPIDLGDTLQALVGLAKRAEGFKQALESLSTLYKIGGIRAPAYPFLFGSSEPVEDKEATAAGAKRRVGRRVSRLKHRIHETADEARDTVKNKLGIGSLEDGKSYPADLSGEGRAALFELLESGPRGLTELLSKKLGSKEPQPLVPSKAAERPMTALHLDDPKQFAMAWPTFPDMYDTQGAKKLDDWAGALTDVATANREFWPTIANHGLAYNLLVANKLDGKDVGRLAKTFGMGWSEELAKLVKAGRLYEIDMSVMRSLEPQTVDDGTTRTTRFTPATVTLLEQDPKSKKLEPVAVHVCGYQGKDAQTYVFGKSTDFAWLYALSAAKCSITLYGIWLGHVYHWHMVTAAMQMTMCNTLPEDHPIYLLLAPQGDYLIGFNDVLLALWEHIAPPTSIISAGQFLDLMNTYAEGRHFFQDDPKKTRRDLGISAEDFTEKTPWDRYPLAGQLLEIWTITERFVKAFVEGSYKTDRHVAKDGPLQAWIKASARDGNIKGLPATVETREVLAEVLTSLVYRIVAHGNSRLIQSLSAALFFVGNYPPCLQRSDIPAPSTKRKPEALLNYLPVTGTIGSMVHFYSIFVFSAPYTSLIPQDGCEKELFFPGGLDDSRNKALVVFRHELITFMASYSKGHPQVAQWPRCIET